MKILVCVDVQNMHLNEMKNAISELKLSADDAIHLVHIFRRNVYADNFLVATYPLEKDEPGIKESVIKSLEDLTSNLPQVSAKYQCECLFSISPKESWSALRTTGTTRPCGVPTAIPIS